MSSVIGPVYIWRGIVPFYLDLTKPQMRWQDALNSAIKGACEAVYPRFAPQITGYFLHLNLQSIVVRPHLSKKDSLMSVAQRREGRTLVFLLSCQLEESFNATTVFEAQVSVLIAMNLFYPLLNPPPILEHQNDHFGVAMAMGCRIKVRGED